MNRPSGTVIVICATVVVCIAIGNVAYIDLHGGNGNSYLATIGALAPTVAALAAFFKSNQANTTAGDVQTKVNQIEQQTNGNLKAQTAVAEQHIPAIAEEISQIHALVNQISTEKEHPFEPDRNEVKS